MNREVLASIIAIGVLAAVSGISTFASSNWQNPKDDEPEVEEEPEEMSEQVYELKKNISAMQESLEKQEEETEKLRANITTFQPNSQL